VVVEFFPVLRGVRQAGILSPYLFTVYVNDLIVHLRQKGYGVHVGHLLVVSAIYADDTALLSASCYILPVCKNLLMPVHITEPDGI